MIQEEADGKDLQELDTKVRIESFRKHGRNRKGLSAGEYLYGFKKHNRLFPTITFVLYYGEKEWDGAKDLHGLLDFTDIPDRLREKVSNYQIHVIEVRMIWCWHMQERKRCLR